MSFFTSPFASSPTDAFTAYTQGSGGNPSWGPGDVLDPWASRVSQIGSTQYGYGDRASQLWGGTYAPSPQGEMFDTTSSLLGWSRITGTVDEWLMREHPELFDFNRIGENGMIQPITSLGGDWAKVDQWDSAVSAASRATGVPANLIKAVMKLESGGENLGRNGAGAIGLMQVVDHYWAGLGYDLYDPAQNIMAGATVLKQMYDKYAGWAQENGVDPWKAALYSYYAGNPHDLNARDDPAQGGSGITTGEYGDLIWMNYQMLNGQAAAQPGMTGTTDPMGNAVVSEALKFVGVPYVWGGIPGKGVDPWAFGGWDCSGFMYWLDQNYGTGELPMGSHYQYQYAVDNGKLFTDPSYLQPGDLVFFDTGNYAGGGAHLNAAGHVGIYIGDGKMLHAANPQMGTIVSDLGEYMSMYGYLGGMRMSFSGGQAGYTGPGGNQYMPSQNNWAGFMRAAATGSPLPGPGYTPGFGGSQFGSWLRGNSPWLRLAIGRAQQGEA